MNVDFYDDSPFFSVISFHKVIEALKEIVKEDKTNYRVEYAKSLLNEVAQVPELYAGITSKKVIYDNVALIQNLLADLFPTALTNNEIKAVSLPFQNFNFNFSKRFQQIIIEAGDAFEMSIRDFSKDAFYIKSCCLILNMHYNQNFDVTQPLFYDIPDKNGVINHYRITYNTDFVEIISTDNAVEITEEDIKLLKNNYDNIALWKEKFPKHSWILKGFGIITLFDVTIENSISTLKSNLIKAEPENAVMHTIERSFRSIFRVSDLKVGIVFLNKSIDDFFEMTRSMNILSYFNHSEIESNLELKKQCLLFFNEVEKTDNFYCISDIDDLIAQSDFTLYGKLLKSKNIESFILAKLNKVDMFQGYIEVVSSQKYQLHSVNSKKLDAVIPFINDTIDRIDRDIQNQFEAIIQREFTTIHPSVYWKFLNESRNYFKFTNNHENYVLKEIEFDSVFPLYGETDIKGSTFLRNLATKNDIGNQLDELINMFELAKKYSSNLLFNQRLIELNKFKNLYIKDFESYHELEIQNYINQYIHPILQKFENYELMKPMVENYRSKLNESLTKYCPSRSKYDATITHINKELAQVIDTAQIKIQKVFPHYFERFKSDGVEHNAFIGASIAPNLIYDDLYLFNLRLWQIQTMCEMVRKHYQNSYDYEIELTSLILIYNFPINIRFRFDEKRFDIGSSSDVRFQTIKKRIDKALVKNTEIRLVQPRFLTLVYLNEVDKNEYENYLNFLIKKKYLTGKIENVEVQDLQDIIGLKALRIEINLLENSENILYYSFSDLD